MTSFIIRAHEGREVSEPWNGSECIFCRIVRNEAPSYRIFENDRVLAILDIQPLRRGHTLVIPKVHCSRVSELPAEYAGATGVAVSRVANAIAKALDNTALNVVCNQEYAQAVPHVHYHVIPAPRFDSDVAKGHNHVTLPLTQREMHKHEFESREELDDEEAISLVSHIRARL
ncbi:HIT-like protein [Panus rudis PR-1116 ss-1]|nr:HIT-like protein [Panus rudis PR-1116 ss-1]